MASASIGSDGSRIRKPAGGTSRWLLGFCLALAPAPDTAFAETPEASGSPAAESTAVDPEAVALARRAGEFLREAKQFSFVAEIGYEVVQSDGSKLEFGGVRRHLVRRPDRVRIESEPREGSPQLTLFDGRSLVHVDLGESVYARADLKEPRDLDFLVDLVRDRLDAPLPLGELLRNDPRPALVDSLELAAIVGRERLRGADCDHLALRNPDADLELWVERGERPLLRRVVVTYRTLEGEPSFRADLGEWSLAPALAEDTFQYVPPPGAERVRFEVRAAPAPQAAVAP